MPQNLNLRQRPAHKPVRYRATSGQQLTLRAPRELEPLERRFLDELLVDMEPAAAARRAIGPDFGEEGAKLLKRPHVNAALLARLQGRAKREGVETDYVLHRWALLEKADPRELSEHWMVPCRRCWGVDHQYQFNDVELRDEKQAHLARMLQIVDPKNRVPFDELGGGGYTILREPCRGPDWVEFHTRRGRKGQLTETADHTCPECYGDGIPHVVFHDTRYLSPGAALLYKGTRLTKGGYEITTRDQDAVRVELAKHLGYYREHTPLTEFDPEKLTDAHLAIVLGHRLSRELEQRSVDVPVLRLLSEGEPEPAESE
jgi:phage terminase small subunit